MFSDEAMVARLIYRDGLMLIIDKPAGIPVHAGPKGGPNLEAHFDALRFGLPQPPSLAHRLDRDTSGCLILGRHRKALRRLGKLFMAGQIGKTYWAVVVGGPDDTQGVIDLPLRKLNRVTGWRVIIDHKEGQAAVTDYKVRGRADGLTWLELSPRTGRTHQIRVHCAALGWPILGDPIYGGDPAAAPDSLHLHARGLSVPLYPGKPAIEVTAPPPVHMLESLRACGFKEADAA